MWKKRIFGSTVIALALAGTVSSVMGEEGVMASEGVVRLKGDNRFETAVNISQAGFDSADTVVIANSHEFADALTGVPLANELSAPLLLTRAHGLNADSRSEIERLNPNEVIILGGETAVSSAVEQELGELASTVTRIGGDNRFQTAELIAERVVAESGQDEAILVNSHNFPDALSVAPVADGRPIFLTSGRGLVESTDAALADFNSTYLIGGDAAIQPHVEAEVNNPTRLSGETRYDTNIKILEYFAPESNELFVATGLDFADALTGSVLAAQEDAGVLLVRNGVNDKQQVFLQNNAFSQFTLFGGASAISANLENEFVEAATNVQEHTALADGLYKVGVDIPAGDYKVVPNEGETSIYKIADEAVEPEHEYDFLDFLDQRWVRLEEGDYLYLEGTTAYHESIAPPYQPVNGIYRPMIGRNKTDRGAGAIYRVGIDIPAGTYNVEDNSEAPFIGTVGVYQDLTFLASLEGEFGVDWGDVVTMPTITVTDGDYITLYDAIIDTNQ